MKESLGLAVGALLLAASPAMAAAIGVVSRTIDVFSYPFAVVPVTAVLDVKPESLEKRSSGVPITVFIELPADFEVRTIDLRSVRLCVGPGACETGIPATGKAKVGDADGDGIRDLKVTFDRAAALALVEAIVPPADVTFAVSGLIGSTALFAGSDTVRLVDP